MRFDAAVGALSTTANTSTLNFLDHLLEMLMFYFFNAHPPISAGEDAEAVKPQASQRLTNTLTANLQGSIACASSWIMLTLLW